MSAIEALIVAAIVAAFVIFARLGRGSDQGSAAHRFAERTLGRGVRVILGMVRPFTL